MAPSGTMKAILHGGGFRVSSSPGISGPVFDMHGAFSNRVLSSSEGGKERAMARIMCIVCGNSGSSLINNLYIVR